MRELAKSEFGKDWKVVSHPTLAEAPDIGNDVWIGADALIRRGITIGTGAIIGARAVVTKDVAPYAVVGGSPARVLKFRFPEPLVKRLLASKWWEYNFIDLPEATTENVDQFLESLEEKKAEGLTAFQPGFVDMEKELFGFMEENKSMWEKRA